MESKIDLFTLIHKAIRALIYDTGNKLQTTDFNNHLQAIEMLNKLDSMLELLEEHAMHEDQSIFPPIESMAPGISKELSEQHEKGEQKLHLLRAKIKQMRNSGAALLDHGSQLQILFTDFVSFYLWHMNREEETILPASQELLSTKDLLEIRSKIQLNMTPDRYAQWMHLMLPALNATELETLYHQIKIGAPRSVFDKICEIGNLVIGQGEVG